MGRFISAMLVLLLAVRVAGADEACAVHDAGPYNVEWVEQGQLRGARVVSRDPRWELEEFDWHGTSSVVCRTCADDQIYSGFLWLGLGDPARRGLQEAVSAGSTASRLGRVYGPLRADFHAEADAAPALMGRLEGRSSIVGVRGPDGRMHHVISFAVADGCIELFGVLSTREGAEISLDRLSAFTSAIEIEWYEPVPEPPPLPPKDPASGAAKRRPEPKRR